MEKFTELVIASLTGASLGAVIIGVVAKAWVEKRIEQSISHEYAKKLVDYQAQVTQREIQLQEQREIRHRAALIADLLSHWITAQGVDRDRLNQLSFEAFLWLPEDIAVDLSNTLARKYGAPSVRDLVVKVRQHLLGSSDSLKPENVIVFDASVGTTQQRRQEHRWDDPRGTNGTRG